MQLFIDKLDLYISGDQSHLTYCNINILAPPPPPLFLLHRKLLNILNLINNWSVASSAMRRKNIMIYGHLY